MNSTTKSALSPARRQLLQVMQELNFGTIEGLAVRGGEPVLAGARVVRLLRFGGDNQPRPERWAPDFSLQDEHRELFAELDRIGDGIVAALEVLHGLPRQMSVAELARGD